MAQGALQHSHGDMSIAVTGIAGPSGGSRDKPVGTVWIAWAKREAFVYAEKQLFSGDREAIRQKNH